MEARRLTVPFDVYAFSPADTMTLESAEALLVRDCMRGQGMTLEVPPLPVEADSEPPNRRRYGVIEPRIADLFGYHVPPDGPSVVAYKDRTNAQDKGLSPKARYAEKGCSQKAQDSLSAGTPKVDDSLFNQLIFKTFDDSQHDGQVVQVFHSWSGCMAGAGFHYADPLAAITDDRWSTDKPSPQEIRAAQADVRCKVKTGLVATWAAAEQRIQSAAIRAHAKDFQALKANKDRQLAAARRVIARG
ncbi:hypothetical protein [Actinoallomurus sp. CA-150999]|uniref:hypothetical protein n=1 Tax=Actinoallomurus sp. CA-150999 TaxID=3239887 RepID=UPI003D94CC02